MNPNEEILIPLIVFSSIIILIGILLYYQYAKKRAFLNTIERAIKGKDDLRPDVIRAIGMHFFSSNKDTRKGVFALLLGLAICGFSVVVDFPKNGNMDLNDALYGIALFPLFGGIGYLLLRLLDKN